MMAATKEQGRTKERADLRGPVRTCAGCGKRDTAQALLRVVFDPSSGEIAVDFAGSSFGRGGHVHPSMDCLQKAAKSGFARVFSPSGASKGPKTKVVADASALASAIVAGADRRIEGLLTGAKRARQVAFGADAVVGVLREGKTSLVVVARDAAAAAQLGEVRDAIATGRAIAWSNKEHLGRLLRAETGNAVAVCAVLNAGVATAIAESYRTSRPFIGKQEESVGAWSSSEVR